MRWFNIKGIVNAIEVLYESSKSAVLLEMKSLIGSAHMLESDKTVCCHHNFQYLSGIYHIEALNGFKGSGSICGRGVTNLRLTDDIDLVAGQAACLLA